MKNRNRTFPREQHGASQQALTLRFREPAGASPGPEFVSYVA